MEFENIVKQFTYNKLKMFEKFNYADFETSKEFYDLMKIDLVEQIICEEY